MLDDARPPVLLAQRRLVDRLPELKAVRAVCIDELSSRQAQGLAFAPTRGESIPGAFMGLLNWKREYQGIVFLNAT